MEGIYPLAGHVTAREPRARSVSLVTVYENRYNLKSLINKLIILNLILFSINTRFLIYK